MIIFKRLKRFLLRWWFSVPCQVQPKISLLIPFDSQNHTRKKVFKWLLEYWKHELPDAEIVIGRSHSKVFCKGRALNDAVKRSKGKVLVVLDADAYLPGSIIDNCADRILDNIDNHLWFVPYRHLYRLTKHATRIILSHSPECPLRPLSPPPPEWVESNGHKSKYGHRYGAMIMMFPREAFNILGCFDERFKGWGGEDVALLRALDTLYGKHKTTSNDILHLWHPYIGKDYKTRVWEGQKASNANDKLANKYNRATGHPSKMRELVDKGCKHKRKHEHD